jgi:hypothetical protein
MYEIKPYSFKQARKLGVDIKPSSDKNKKIDVLKDGKKIASIGDTKYMKNDYPTYIQTKGLEYANKRRDLYKIRHKKDKDIKNSAGFFASRILW